MPSPARTDDPVDLRFQQRYRRQNMAAAALRVGLWPLAALMPRRQPAVVPASILIANAGHLGDAILSTSVLRPLRDTFPQARIGFLAGPYARPVLDGHPLIDRLHILNHWFASRTGSSRAERLRLYVREARQMRAELMAENYDLAIDLHAWFPNNILLLASTGIHTRIGTDRFGFSGFLTRNVPYNAARRHEIEGMRDLLRAAGVAEEAVRAARPELIPPTESARREAAAIAPQGRFAIIHPTASTGIRDWPLENWHALARRLLADGLTPVITGHGKRDEQNAAAIRAATPEAVNAVGRLGWPALGALLERAEIVFCVETSIGHYARALGRPVVSIMGGMADPMRWGPLGAEIATAPQDCSPCLQKQGCATRACLTQLDADSVLAAVHAAKRRAAE